MIVIYLISIKDPPGRELNFVKVLKRRATTASHYTCKSTKFCNYLIPIQRQYELDTERSVVAPTDRNCKGVFTQDQQLIVPFSQLHIASLQISHSYQLGEHISVV
jgi:hypothetical protein